MSTSRRERPDQYSPDPSISTSPAGPAAPGSLSWPEAFLAAVIVLAGFTYHYLSVRQGTDPAQAVRYLIAIAVPLVALVLPSTVLGGATRAVCRALGAVFSNLGNGGTR
ncbi:hypothetical protein ACFXNW_28890 [Nocardia sp. NPDC059180]|uniref:hypothetical protein n=1 Tax=Nocardia sp. NPDC059180 TaxID=3346761 RepID=UPI0036843312